MLKIQFIGNLGDNAKIIDNGSFRPFTTFPVAVSEPYKDQLGAVINRTLWVHCNINRDCANLRPYLLKGTKVYISGSFRTRIFTTKDNQTSVGIDCFVDTIELCGSKPSQNQNDHETDAADKPF